MKRNTICKNNDFDYQIQIDEIKSSNAYLVDAKAFEKYWHMGWICYIDLLAFSESCKISRQSTVNTIVRFHKIIENAAQRIPGDIYQFTDCCFYVSDMFESTLKFALCVMNGCCAMNKITFDKKDLVKAHFLLRPRITIAYGEYINASKIGNRYLASQVNPSSFLAGSGIVYAYETEKQSFSHAITINFSQSSKKPNDFFELGGNTSLAKAGLKKWLELSLNQKITHFPWPYVKNLYLKKDKIHIVPKNNDEFFEMESNLFLTAEKMQREFICDNIALNAAKHPMALKRFAIELYKNAKNAKQITDAILQELEHKIKVTVK